MTDSPASLVPLPVLRQRLATIGTDPSLHFESVELRAVPEPSTLVLRASGGLVAAMRQRKSQTRDPSNI